MTWCPLSQCDSEQPIPYSVTDDGRFAIAESEIEFSNESCQHDWNMVRPGVMACRRCWTERKVTRGAGIPAYLGAKRRNG